MGEVSHTGMASPCAVCVCGTSVNEEGAPGLAFQGGEKGDICLLSLPGASAMLKCIYSYGMLIGGYLPLEIV